MAATSKNSGSVLTRRAGRNLAELSGDSVRRGLGVSIARSLSAQARAKTALSEHAVMCMCVPKGAEQPRQHQSRRD
eukprot:9341603-Alexandrium_andersonii.AAC.1